MATCWTSAPRRRAPNLFERISFNVGPTLHAWLEEHAPDVDAAIRAADAVAMRREGRGTPTGGSRARRLATAWP